MLADFIVELSPPITNEEEGRTWKLYVDGSSNNKGSEAGIILEDQNGVSIKQYLKNSRLRLATTKPNMKLCWLV